MTDIRTSNDAFSPTWESLQQYRCPDWFRDAKFGIYTHWGVYAVPAFRTEWYPHYMYQPGHPIHEHHVETYGPLSRFGYKDFVPRFTAERFDPDEWAELFARAGARFAGPVTEHADGFAMWDTELTEWNAGAKGPKCDVVGEMAAAVRRRGLRFVASFHHHWLWGWFASEEPTADSMGGRWASLYGRPLPLTAFGRKGLGGRLDYRDVEPSPDETFCRRWLAKVNEVVDRHRPDLMYFDGRMTILPERYRLEMASHYYNRLRESGTQPVLTYKGEDMAPGTGTLDFERGRAADILPEPWLTDTSVARNSWGYTDDLDYYTPERLVHDIADIVSKNGCVMLNVAPRADGTIPEEQKEMLTELGGWLRINGEAIYGTRPWTVFGEGPTEVKAGHFADLQLRGFTPTDIRFTVKGDSLYAIVLGIPEGPVRIAALGSAGHPDPIETVSLLGSEEPVAWQRTDDAFIVEPWSRTPSQHAVVLKITFAR